MEGWCLAKIKDMYLFRSQPNTQFYIFSLVLSYWSISIVI